MSSILQRGQTWYARLHIPENRWADVGEALGARSGIKRDVVKTLQTTDRREAQRRREPAMAAIRAEVDAALVEAGKPPLTDWTAEWATRALERRQEIAAGRGVVKWTMEDPTGQERPVHRMADEVAEEAVEYEAEVLEARHGPKVAERFSEIALGQGLTIGLALRQWLEGERGRVRRATAAGHEAAMAKLGAYLAAREGWPSLDTAPLSAVSRRIAGEFLAERRASSSAGTVLREFSGYSGLWRWAVRRGYAEVNPWADQTAGMRSPREDEGGAPKRGYTSAEIVKLLRAGPTDLAPARGGYAATFWDAIRLALLTGARADEVFGLTVGDVLEDGTAIAVAAQGRGKTEAASRIIPLHAHAQRVMRDRLAGLPSLEREASLWPEVPATGKDLRRSKIIASRFPIVRRRILGEGEGVDWHSFRRSWITAAETAMHAHGRLNAELVALLVGHQRKGLAFTLYSDWARLGRGRLTGALRDRLGTLAAAIEDAVALGFDEDVKRALQETAGGRPPVLRMAPAFRREVPVAPTPPKAPTGRTKGRAAR